MKIVKEQVISVIVQNLLLFKALFDNNMLQPNSTQVNVEGAQACI